MLWLEMGHTNSRVFIIAPDHRISGHGKYKPAVKCNTMQQYTNIHRYNIEHGTPASATRYTRLQSVPHTRTYNSYKLPDKNKFFNYTEGSFFGRMI